MNRLGMKLACLVVSIVIWFLVASNESREETLDLPLEVLNLPPACTLAGNDLPQTVGVRMRGSKLHLLAHQTLGIRAGRVALNLAGEQPGPPIQREITINDVQSDNMQVLAITPPLRVKLRIDRQETLSVLVEVVTEGALPPQRQLLAQPIANPAKVNLVGPARFFTGGERVWTEPIDLARIKTTSTLRKRLVSPHPHLVPERSDVAVNIHISAVESRTLAHVPIVPLVDADQPEATVFPPVADLVISGPVDSVRALIASRVSVTVPLSGLPEGLHHVRGQVILPDGFGLVSMAPEEFTAIIGEDGLQEQEQQGP